MLEESCTVFLDHCWRPIRRRLLARLAVAQTRTRQEQQPPQQQQQQQPQQQQPPKSTSSIQWHQKENSGNGAINDNSSTIDDADQQQQPIFLIDGNGDRFPYILDYMRDKEVHLPLSVPKAALLRDFEYYGFDLNHNIRVEDIHDGSSSVESSQTNRPVRITVPARARTMPSDCEKISKEDDVSQCCSCLLSIVQ